MATIKDVAALAGVSFTTVSHVINNTRPVNSETRKRVEEAIRATRYVPSAVARSLKHRTTRTIGVLVPTATNPYFAELARGIEDVCAAAGYSVILCNSDDDPRKQRDYLRVLMEKRVDGIIVSSAGPDHALIEALGESALPVVMVDGDPSANMPLVTVDQGEGARLATQHLLDVGHATVWHVSGPTEWFDAAGRIEGWRRTLEAAGAEAPPTIAADWSASSGYQAGLMLARMPDVTAVFAANDHQALGIMRALQERGRRVPADVSVVGFDDVPEAAYFLPPLTTIRADFDEVARLTLAMLLGQITGRETDGLIQRIAPVLVSRASVAPPQGQ